MRVDEIENITDLCTGCAACIDACPKKCIKPILKDDGFRYVSITKSECIQCGKCAVICPVANFKKHKEQQHLYAVYAKDNEIRNGGSSGGVFGLLAKYFLSKGYAVCGAAFDGTILRHRIIRSVEKLSPLLKSKYLQSDTNGIYREIMTALKNGEKIFFCGTPCQVSALKNSVPEDLQAKLFTADIICHGVPSQKVFDEYIETIEKKGKGKIQNFSFRVKNNKYRHAHGFSYLLSKNACEKIVNGIYLQSSYYNAFKKYLFFRESCYECRYATLDRVSDITLGDFWGIEKYNFPVDIDKGVSMVIVNTPEGEEVFKIVSSETVYHEFPIEYGVESNYCLTHATKKPIQRDIVMESLENNGYEATARRFFKCSFVEKIYSVLPSGIRNLRKKLRRK